MARHDELAALAMLVGPNADEVVADAIETVRFSIEEAHRLLDEVRAHGTDAELFRALVMALRGAFLGTNSFDAIAAEAAVILDRHDAAVSNGGRQESGGAAARWRSVISDRVRFYYWTAVGGNHVMAQDVRAGRDAYRRALECPRADTALLAQGHAMFAFALVCDGYFAEAYRWLNRTWTIVESDPHYAQRRQRAIWQNATMIRADLAEWCEDYARSLALWTASMAMVNPGQQPARASTLAGLGRTAARCGKLQTAREALDAAIRTTSSSDLDFSQLSKVAQGSAYYYLAAGQPELGLEACDRAEEHHTSGLAPAFLIELRLAKASLLGALGRWRDVVATLGEFEPGSITPLYRLNLVRHLAPALIGLDRTAEVRALVEETAELTSRRYMVGLEENEGSPTSELEQVVSSRYIDSSRRKLRAVHALRQHRETSSKATRVVSHDLRSPLTSLQLLVELDPDRASVDGHDLVEQIDSLLDSLTEFAPEAIHVEVSEIELNGQLDQIVADLTPQAEVKGQRLGLSCPASTFCLADPIALVRIMNNLLSNAVKFSPPGSRIWVEAVTAGADHVSINVHDAGPGLTEDDFTSLFTWGKTLSATSTAEEAQSGYGLYIADHLARAIGGRLRAFNDTAGTGAIFSLLLPRSEHAAEASTHEGVR